MKPDERLLICGASARAAAQSAQRAGLPVMAFDLFGDVDLQETCPTVRIKPDNYPAGFPAAVLASGMPGPWMYTGALENHPEIVEAISQDHPLWGCHPAALGVVRDPHLLVKLIDLAGLPVAEVRPNYLEPPADGSWLVKPIASAGGSGIKVWRGQPLPQRSGRGCYFQKLIPGEPHAAIFFGDGTEALLLGVTRQLVGVPWLHARPFAYCGSVGPVDLGSSASAELVHLGNVLTEAAGLRGLFGVDFMLHEGRPWVVEVNPRYTASVEILESHPQLATFRLLEAHFAEGQRLAGLQAIRRESEADHPTHSLRFFVAKGTLFAENDFVLQVPVPRWVDMEYPIADIPAPGTHIHKGQPIITVFADALNPESAVAALREAVTDLDRWFFPL